MSTLTRPQFDAICDRILKSMEVLDTDNDGTITKEELVGYFTDCGITEANINELLKKFDTSCTLGVFLHLLVNAFPCTPEMRLFMFKIDAEKGNFHTETVEDDMKDGYLSLDELQAFVAKNKYILTGLQTEQDCISRFNALDTDGDGKLNPVEAAEILQNDTPTHLFDLLKELVSVAYSMDKDESGTIEPKELADFLAGLKISKSVTDKAFAKNPACKSKSIKFLSFMHFMVDIFIASQGK